ncbi:MAG: stage II sporulation protein R [Clostridia bacterium]|nr:stage II sporulation protein R [Clostridia bacterium]
MKRVRNILYAAAKRLAASKLLRIELAVIVGTLSVLTYTAAAAIGEQREIAERVLRLHVVAASDSAEDQALKLSVRDHLLATYGEELTAMPSVVEATAWAQAHLPELQAAAEAVLAAQGCDASVTASVCREVFPTRTYDALNLPAGEYTALKLVIGAGAGKNWWCVMFPPLCTAAALDTAVFTDGQWRTLTNDAPDITIRFRLLEWWYALVELFD